MAGINRVVTVLDPTTRREVRMPISVASMSGHKEGSRAFARYREIDEDMKRDLVSMLE